jgi:hypothetical protein
MSDSPWTADDLAPGDFEADLTALDPVTPNRTMAIQPRC